ASIRRLGSGSIRVRHSAAGTLPARDETCEMLDCGSARGAAWLFLCSGADCKPEYCGRRDRGLAHAGGEASAECAAAYVWRVECRGLFFGGWEEADFPVDARRSEVRPDFHDECGRLRSEDGFDRKGTHNLRLYFSA